MIAIRLPLTKVKLHESRDCCPSSSLLYLEHLAWFLHRVSPEQILKEYELSVGLGQVASAKIKAGKKD